MRVMLAYAYMYRNFPLINVKSFSVRSLYLYLYTKSYSKTFERNTNTSSTLSMKTIFVWRKIKKENEKMRPAVIFNSLKVKRKYEQAYVDKNFHLVETRFWNVSNRHFTRKLFTNKNEFFSSSILEQKQLVEMVLLSLSLSISFTQKQQYHVVENFVSIIIFSHYSYIVELSYCVTCRCKTHSINTLLTIRVLTSNFCLCSLLTFSIFDLSTNYLIKITKFVYYYYFWPEHNNF